MDNEKRMIESYEVKHALHLAGGEVILAEDDAAADPFMVCDCSRDNPFNADVYTNVLVGDDYLEAMREYIKRVAVRVDYIEAERSSRGVTHIPLTADDCIKGSHRENYTNQLIVIKPESMTPSARTADKQLLLATSGNGCNPDGHGTAVFCKNLFTGETSRWNRYDIAGMIDPHKMPEWVVEKLTALQKQEEKAAVPAAKESILARLEDAKNGAARDNPPPKEKKEKGREL